MAKYVSIRNLMTNATESDVMHIMNDFFNAGVILDTDNSFKLTVDTGLTCNLNAGRAYIRNFDYTASSDVTNFYRIVSTDTDSISFSSNSSGSTRYDTVVLKFNKSVNSNTDADNIVSVEVIEGTPGSGVLSDSDITSSLGSDYFWLRLWDVKIADGATTLTNDDLIDRRTLVNIPEVIEVGNNNGKFSNLEDAIEYINKNSDIQSAYIRLASGTFTINDAIEVHKPIVIIGRGISTKIVVSSSVSDATDAIQAWWYSGSYYDSTEPKIFILKDLYIEDERTTHSGTDASDIVSIDHADFVRVDNVYFKGGADSQLFLSECETFSITNSYFDTCDDLGLYIDNTDLSIKGGYVAGNKFVNTTAGGVAIKRNGGKVVVANNSVYNAGNGVTLEDTGEAGDSVLGLNNSDQCVITGNVIQNIHTVGQGQFGIMLKASNNVIVANNFINDIGVYGIRIVASRYNIIADNQIKNCDTRCVHIGAFDSVKSEHNAFIGNIVSDSPQGIIEIPDEADWNTFGGNKYKRIADFSSANTGSGTATFTKNSNIVTGSGSTWSSEIANTSYVWLESNGDEYAVEVEQRVSDTKIRLKGDYTGAGGSGTIKYVTRGPGLQVRGIHSKVITDYDDEIAWGYYNFYLKGFLNEDSSGNIHRYLDFDVRIPSTGEDDANAIVRFFRNTHVNPGGTGSGTIRVLFYPGDGSGNVVWKQEGDNIQFYVPLTMKVFSSIPTTSDLTTSEMAIATDGTNAYLVFNHAGTIKTIPISEQKDTFKLKIIENASKPTTSDLPSDYFAIWKNTTDNKTYFCYNDSGTIKTIQISEETDTFKLKRIESATAPTSSDIPLNYHAIWRDTTNNKTYLCYNEGGTILKVELT